MGEAFAKMNSSQKDQVISLLGKTQDKGSLSPQMTNLLQSGKLLAKDKSGHTVLSHLNRLAQDPLQKGVNRKSALNDLAGTINDYKTWNQDGQGTCTVTSTGREHARTMPSDFARVTTDLLTKGESKTIGGATVKTASVEFGKADGSGRSQIERAYQDAMMELGNGSRTYDAQEDKHSGWRKRGGLGTEGQAKVIQNVLGRDVGAKGFVTEGGFADDLKTFTDKGERMQVGMRWSKREGKHGYHALSVSTMKGDYVYLDNPWGESKNLPEGVERHGEGGQVRMNKEEFFSRLRGYTAYDVGMLESFGSKFVKKGRYLADKFS